MAIWGPSIDLASQLDRWTPTRHESSAAHLGPIFDHVLDKTFQIQGLEFLIFRLGVPAWFGRAASVIVVLIFVNTVLPAATSARRP